MVANAGYPPRARDRRLFANWNDSETTFGRWPVTVGVGQGRTPMEVVMRWVRRRHPETIAMKTVMGIASCAFAAAFAWSLSSVAQTPAAGSPSYSTSGELIRPTDYREWVYVTSGLGMTYGSAQ